MIRINLLPHREERRKARRQQFFALTGLIVLLATLIWILGFSILSGYISAQDEKNAFLKREIATLDKDIDEIKHLKEQTESLLSRKRIIESLQSNRAETVLLFNELARQTPDGVFLRSLKQSDTKINLQGYAQSDARVSTLMRNLEASALLESPQLVEIKAATVNSRRVAEFNLDIFVNRQKASPGERAKVGGQTAVKGETP